MTLTTLDKNFLYSIAIEKAQWHNRDEGKLEDCISFELNNFDNLIPIDESVKIPGETTFIMSIEDAKYLKSFLEVALNNL